MRTLKHWMIVAAMCLGLAMPAWARLGETKAGIEKRYGHGEAFKADRMAAYAADILTRLGVKPEDELPLIEGCVFTKQNWVIFVVFLDGKSVCEKYFRDDSDTIEDAEVANFLSVNSLGKEWKPTPTIALDGTAYYDRNHRRWELNGAAKNKPPKLAATAALDGRSLQITMQSLFDYINATHAKALKQEEERKAKALKVF